MSNANAWRRDATRTITLAFVAALVAGGISYLWPKTYKAEAKILPTVETTAASSLVNLATSGLSDLLGSSLSGAENPFRTYPEIVSSRLVLERVLHSGYPTHQSSTTVISALGVDGADRKSLDQGIRKLRSVTRAETNPRSGLIVVSAVTRDSVLSAYVVTRLLEELDRFNMDTRSSRERATRQFVEGRVAEARRDLAQAEQALTSFRQGNLRIGNSPQLQLESARLEREVETRSELYRLLAREYEMARIEEKRDTPTFSVVEPATPPVRKHSPKTVANMLIAFVGTAGLGMLSTRLGPLGALKTKV